MLRRPVGCIGPYDREYDRESGHQICTLTLYIQTWTVIAVREADVERLLERAVETAGGKAFKFTSPGNAGVQDRLVLLNGRAYFVELKAPGQKLRPLQRYRQRQLKRLGFEPYVIDSVAGVREFVEAISTP